jgi:DNA adenine methylase
MDSVISWIGGKRLLRKEIAKHIPSDIQAYIEPFGGAAWVMFYRDRWAPLEVYNDLDGRLVNLFLQVKFHPEELIRELDLMLASRAIFDTILSQPGMTEIQRAARFLFTITRSFGGKGDNFAISQSQPPSSLQRRLERIRLLHRRLDQVVVENLDFSELITRYDRPTSFFYCDPPYTRGYTYDNSKQFDHEQLHETLARVGGRWILSYDDSPVVHQLYKGYHIKRVSRVKGINRKAGPSDYNELIIANFPFEE